MKSSRLSVLVSANPSNDANSGRWEGDERHGKGSCQFVDGTLFHGTWQNNHWLQSEAEPSLSRVAGPGLAGAVAGETGIVTILVRLP